jgi:hypothetical protein
MAKPNHLPFSEWIQTGELLSPEQQRSLQEHLRSCPECSQVQAALEEVQLLFQSVGSAAPVPGFVDRWQERLILHRSQQQRRTAWILFFCAAFMAIFLLSLISWRTLIIFSSPTAILSALVYLWTLAFVATENLRDLALGLVRFLPPLTTLGFIFFIGFVSLVGVLWLVAYRQLTAVRRIL